jgi:hypothetical protein
MAPVPEISRNPQSPNSNRAKVFGLGEFDPILDSLSNANIPQNDTAGVIVQFLDGEEIASKGLIGQPSKKAAKEVRSWAVAEASPAGSPAISHLTSSDSVLASRSGSKIASRAQLCRLDG